MSEDWDNESMKALMKLPMHARRAVMAFETHSASKDELVSLSFNGKYNLEDCPPGLLRIGGELAVKSEYRNDKGEPLAYIIATGERLDIGAQPVESLKITDPIQS